MPYLTARLNAEWKRLASSPAAAAAMASWVRAEPDLACYRDLETLRTAAHDRTDLDRGDRILAALVRLASVTGHDDLLATQVLLHLLMPGAITLSKRLTAMAGDPTTSEALVFAHLTIGIRTYPWQRRPHRIAANLLLDCRQRILRSHRRTAPEVPAGLDLHDDRAGDSANDSRLVLLDLLSWARRQHILDPFEIRLLIAHYVNDTRVEDLTTVMGKSRSTLFALRNRAEARLRDAVAAWWEPAG